MSLLPQRDSAVTMSYSSTGVVKVHNYSAATQDFSILFEAVRTSNRLHFLEKITLTYQLQCYCRSELHSLRINKRILEQKYDSCWLWVYFPFKMHLIFHMKRDSSADLESDFNLNDESMLLFFIISYTYIYIYSERRKVKLKISDTL